jgi:hypothetical protein
MDATYLLKRLRRENGSCFFSVFSNDPRLDEKRNNTTQHTTIRPYLEIYE